MNRVSLPLYLFHSTGMAIWVTDRLPHRSASTGPSGWCPSCASTPCGGSRGPSPCSGPLALHRADDLGLPPSAGPTVRRTQRRPAGRAPPAWPRPARDDVGRRPADAHGHAAAPGTTWGCRSWGSGSAVPGTNSLKLALEQLLGGRCHHMHEVFDRPGARPAVDGGRRRAGPTGTRSSTATWRRSTGRRPASGGRSPTSTPTRSCCSRSGQSAEEWWTSARRTIFESLAIDGRPARDPGLDGHGARPHREPRGRPVRRGGRRWRPTTRHLAEVRAAVPADRLVEWTTGDGWAPLCEALGVPVPDRAVPPRQHHRGVPRRLGLGDPRADRGGRGA